MNKYLGRMLVERMKIWPTLIFVVFGLVVGLVVGSGIVSITLYHQVYHSECHVVSFLPVNDDTDKVWITCNKCDKNLLGNVICHPILFCADKTNATRC